MDGPLLILRRAAGAIFPPLVVFEEGDRFWLAEGFHRAGAYAAAGITEVPCKVRQGGLRDAILHSAGANATHGVRRSNADKRRAVMMLLQDHEWGKWSAREIARRCAVDHKLVSKLREPFTGEIPSEADPRTYRDRHGNVTQMNTARIGRQAAEPAPAVALMDREQQPLTTPATEPHPVRQLLPATSSPYPTCRAARHDGYGCRHAFCRGR